MQRELQSEGDLYSVLPEVPASNWLFVPQDHQHGMLYIGMHKTSRYTEHVAKLEEIVKQAITNKEHTTLANKYEALRRNYEIRIHHNIACTEHKNIPTRIKNEACIPAPVEDSHQQLLQTFHVELLSCYGAMLKAKHNGLVLARYLELELVPAGMSSKQRPQVPDPPQWFTRDREAIKKKAAINKMPLLIKLCKEAKEELLNELVKEEEAMSPSKEALEAKQKKATQAFLRKLNNLSRSGRAAMVPKPEPSTDTRKVKEELKFPNLNLVLMAQCWTVGKVVKCGNPGSILCPILMTETMVRSRLSMRKHRILEEVGILEVVEIRSGKHSRSQNGNSVGVMPTQRKNLIDLGHDLGNRDQDKVDPGQESRFLARMAKILLINFFILLVKRNPTAIAI
eukprot:Em0003g1888a